MPATLAASVRAIEIRDLRFEIAQYPVGSAREQFIREPSTDHLCVVPGPVLLPAHHSGAVRTRHQSSQRHHVSLNRCVSRNRYEAASSKALQQRSLGRASQTRRLVIERANDLIHNSIVGASFNRECALPDRGQHEAFAQVFGNSISVPQSMKSRGGKNDRVELTFVKFSQSRVDVSANRLDHEIRTRGAKLSLTAKTAGADDGSLAKLTEGPDPFASDKRIAHVFALADRGDVQARRQLGWQVLKTVNREVYAARKDRVFEFFGEQPLALLTKLRKRDIQSAIAFG